MNPMALSLCLDTSILASVALIRDQETLATAIDPHPRRHAEGLGQLVEQCVIATKSAANNVADVAAGGVSHLLSQQGITRICVGRGPGPFTAVRAGLAFASALGKGLGVPTYGVSSLDLLARAALDRQGNGFDSVLVVTDAKRREVFFGRYKEKGSDDVRALIEPSVGPVEEALAAAGKALVVMPFSIVDTISVEFQGFPVLRLDPQAQVLAKIVTARLNQGLEEELVLDPIYLRRPDVHRKSGE